LLDDNVNATISKKVDWFSTNIVCCCVNMF
jgi:hypothetical protein